ncbi:hypothetical protein CDCA_CDCA09G2726 [Cyanidium caldarium]|uniref:Uncharacterized protein n=1 Tax=Cyanidium caldarium TaxID=2771 RepID=A0AAV9IX57_CYACA|nr:hypothetical protein CDCA_CDCA09G2726 [Cyanidium caldarium]
MKEPSGVSEFCTTNSLSACTAFLNDSLASLGYRPSLRPPKPAFDEKLTRPARPLAARQNCGEPLVETVEQPPSKGVDQGRVEEALAAALNVIYRLLRDVESTAERQNYSCAQISALRKQIHDDNREIRRIDHAALAREQQLRKRVAQLELELERSQAALRAALARAETLRVDNARLADEINVQAHRMRRLEIRQTKPRLQPRSVANVGAAKVVSPSGDQPLGSEAVGVGIQQGDVNELDRATQQNALLWETVQMVQVELQSIVLSPNATAHPVVEDEKANIAGIGNAGDLVAVDRHLYALLKQLREQTHQRRGSAGIPGSHAEQLSMTALQDECAWLRHQLELRRRIITEQEEMLVLAVAGDKVAQ